MIVCYIAYYYVSRYCSNRRYVPTIVFSWIVMLRSDGLRTCISQLIVLAHQFVTVLATIMERQISSRGMSLIVSAGAIFGSTNAKISV